MDTGHGHLFYLMMTVTFAPAVMLLNSKLSPGPGNEDRSGHERQKLLNRERMSKEDPIIRQKCADYEPIYFELTRDDRVHKVDLKFHDSLFSRSYRAEPPGSVDLARDWLALAAREPGMPDGTGPDSFQEYRDFPKRCRFVLVAVQSWWARRNMCS